MQSQSTSWSLVSAAASRDTAAQDRFYRQYSEVVRSYLASRWRVGPSADVVDEALQEVFLACFRPGGALERVAPGRPGGFRAYLYAVTRNVARSVERRRSLSTFESDIYHIAGAEETPSAAFDRAWAEMIAADAMELFIERSKTPQQRDQSEILQLRFVDGLMPRQIVERFPGMTARRVSKLLERAMVRYYNALIDTVRANHPGEGPNVVERRCRDLLELL